MSATKKLSTHLKQLQSENPDQGFVAGGNYVRHLFETALRERFGSLGLDISDYLVNEYLKEAKKLKKKK